MMWERDTRDGIGLGQAHETKGPRAGTPDNRLSSVFIVPSPKVTEDNLWDLVIDKAPAIRNHPSNVHVNVGRPSAHFETAKEFMWEPVDCRSGGLRYFISWPS
jgi:hypothetical protein